MRRGRESDAEAKRASSRLRLLLRDALTRGMRAVSLAAVKAECERRLEAGEFVAVDPDGMTAIPDCYAVGRITGLPSQAAISSGDGARVAIGIIQRIRGGYYVDHDT